MRAYRDGAVAETAPLSPDPTAAAAHQHADTPRSKRRPKHRVARAAGSAAVGSLPPSSTASDLPPSGKAEQASCCNRPCAHTLGRDTPPVSFASPAAQQRPPVEALLDSAWPASNGAADSARQTYCVSTLVTLGRVGWRPSWGWHGGTCSFFCALQGPSGAAELHVAAKQDSLLGPATASCGCDPLRRPEQKPGSSAWKAPQQRPVTVRLTLGDRADRSRLELRRRPGG